MSPTLSSQKNVNWAIPKKIAQFTLTPFSCAMNPLTTQGDFFFGDDRCAINMSTQSHKLSSNVRMQG
jgi:hypothetical protein